MERREKAVSRESTNAHRVMEVKGESVPPGGLLELVISHQVFSAGGISMSTLGVGM